MVQDNSFLLKCVDASLSADRPKAHRKYAPGDQVRYLRTNPPTPGIVVQKHRKQDEYFVRLEKAANDIITHASKIEPNT